MNLDLFGQDDLQQPIKTEKIGEQAFVFRGFAQPWVERLKAPLADIIRQAPFRHLVTPGGFTMSVGMTCCGLGWTSDRSGYRYSPLDPQTGLPWPAIPPVFLEMAAAAANAAGFDTFQPDACLINHYAPGSRLTLHQDKDERHYEAPIVSLSLGLPATFLFGGHERSDRTQRISLFSGDMVVWGGVDRLRYHGIMPLKEGQDPQWGARRINLTFRKAQ